MLPERFLPDHFQRTSMSGAVTIALTGGKNEKNQGAEKAAIKLYAQNAGEPGVRAGAPAPR